MTSEYEEKLTALEAQKNDEISDLRTKYEKKLEKQEGIANAKIQQLQDQNSDLSTRLKSSEQAHNKLITEHELLKQQNEENLRLINELRANLGEKSKSLDKMTDSFNKIDKENLQNNLAKKEFEKELMAATSSNSNQSVQL